jgi:hypothetical protein
MIDKSEVKMIDTLIKMHKKNCNMLLISFMACLSILIMNIDLWIAFKNLSAVSIFCSGTLVFTIIFNWMTWEQERLDLKLEKERRAFYKKVDPEEQEHLRWLATLSTKTRKEDK